MKKLILLIASVAINHATLSAQGCLPEGFTFTTQAQIDSFQINYPGCTEIEGDVTIDGYNSNISNLNGFNVLTSINSNLTIASTSLTDLNGLNALSVIGGDVYLGFLESPIFYGNYYLTSLTGLEGLDSIGGNLNIIGNSSMQI